MSLDDNPGSNTVCRQRQGTLEEEGRQRQVNYPVQTRVGLRYYKVSRDAGCRGVDCWMNRNALLFYPKLFSLNVLGMNKMSRLLNPNFYNIDVSNLRSAADTRTCRHLYIRLSRPVPSPQSTGPIPISWSARDPNECYAYVSVQKSAGTPRLPRKVRLQYKAVQVDGKTLF